MELKIKSPLDPQFMPMSVALRDYERAVASAEQKADFVVNVERNQGYCDYYRMDILPDGADDEATVDLMDRLVKTLLWCRGGWKLTVSGSRVVYEHLKAAYAPGGSRAFDADFMATVYERPFEVHYA